MAQVLHAVDFVTLVVYFVLVIGFGIWSSYSKSNRSSVGGYFLASRSMHFIPVGASLFASNIGSAHFIGLAGSASVSGIGVAGFEVFAPWIILLLGWFFLPVYIRAGVYTMPEYLQKRFGGDRIRIYMSVLSLLLYITTKISGDLYSGALFLQLTFNINLYLSTAILLIISALFTIAGGLKAVIWTDFISTVIMLVGAFSLMIIGFVKLDGFEELKNKYGYAVPSTTLFSNATCGIPRKDYFSLVRDVNSDYPWTGMLFGYATSGIWYWCTDQVIVQRVLAAKNMVHAKLGCVTAALLKFLPLFFLILPGMISRILYTDDVACVDPNECIRACGNEKGCTNLAYPNLVINLMPIGARGLMLAVMMAALMSSLTSVFNSSSAIFTMDIWKRLRTNAKEWELMIVGRVFTLILATVSILWIPIIQQSQGGQLFDYIQAIGSYLAPPVCAIFILAITFERINEKGAFYGLIFGLLVGMIRFVWEQLYETQPCFRKHLDKRPAVITQVHYLHFRIILFVTTVIVTVVVSLLTKPIPRKYIQRLTFGTIYSKDEPQDIPSDKGLFNKGCCTGAYLDDEDEAIEMTSNKNSIKVNEIEDNSTLSKIERFQKNNHFVRAFFFICGIDTNMLNKDTLSKHLANKPTMDTSIHEDKFLSLICDLSGIFTVAACGFIIAFFNQYN